MMWYDGVCVHLLTLFLDSVQVGVTALMVAAQNGHCGVVRMLMEAKANINIMDNVSTY